MVGDIKVLLVISKCCKFVQLKKEGERIFCVRRGLSPGLSHDKSILSPPCPSEVAKEAYWPYDQRNAPLCAHSAFELFAKLSAKELRIIDTWFDPWLPCALALESIEAHWAHAAISFPPLPSLTSFSPSSITNLHWHSDAAVHLYSAAPTSTSAPWLRHHHQSSGHNRRVQPHQLGWYNSSNF